jgi:WD40 repeat protein
MDRASSAEQAEVGPSETPYRGLAPFAESDYDYFFGRGKDAGHIAASTITESLAVLFGPSGVGKSSVLGAALPRALNAIIDGTLVVPFFRWEPGFYPILLQRARARARIPEDVEAASLEAVAKHWIETNKTPVVFVFDQFEQYFLIPMAGDDKNQGVHPAFEIDVARTANRRDLDAHVLISIREDALYELDRLRGRLPCILSDPMRLDYLDEAATRLAIREPLQVFRQRHGEDLGPTEIEDALVDELLAKARRTTDPQHYETPYLQLVLERLWNEERRAGSPSLRRETYDCLGGWEGIATSHVGHTLETALSEDGRALCAALFDRMVTPSGMKITLAASDLADMVNAPAEQVEAVLTALGHPESRIIRTVTSPQDPERKRYEIFHDVLARPILAWKHAFNSELEQRRMREEADREQRRLREEAEAERARQQSEIEEQMRRAAEQKRIATRFRRISLAAMALAVMALLLAGWAGYSYREAAKQRARVLAMRADWTTNSGDSRQGLLLALEALPQEHGLVEWFRRPIIDEAVHALERVLFRPFGRTLGGHQDRVTQVAYSPDGKSILTASEDQTVRIWDATAGGGNAQPLILQHQAPVSSARFSRDGQFVITAAQDGWAYIWDARDGRKLTQWQVSAGRPTFVDISADNTRIAAASFAANATLWTWDPEQPVADAQPSADEPPSTDRKQREPPKLATELRDADGVTHADGANFIALDATGERAVTTSWGGDARIWDVRTGRLIRTLLRATGYEQMRCMEDGHGHCGPVVSAAFSATNPDRLVTASSDKTARIWNLKTGRVIRTLAGHSRPVTDAAFIADGSRVLTAGLDGSVRIWDAGSGEMLQVLQGPAVVAGTQASAALSPDGQQVVASFSDTAAHLWSVRGDLQPFVLPKLSDAVPSAALGPDDRLLVTAIGTAIDLYDPRSGRLLAEPVYLDGAVMSVAISPDGHRLLAATGDHAEVLALSGWSGSGPPRPLRRLDAHAGLVLCADYDNSGKRIVTASQDGTARIWNATSGLPVGEPLRHRGAVFSAVFSRDGSRVLTGSFDGTVRIWRAEDGAPLRRIDINRPVLEAAFTSDGDHVVVTTLEVPEAPMAERPFFRTTTEIWDDQTGERLDASNPEALQDVKFLQLANHVVVGNKDGSIRLSGALGEDPVAVLPGHRGSIKRIVTSPSGERLATVSADGSIRVWKLPPADPHALIAYADRIADEYLAADQRTFSAAERAAFGLGEHDQPLREWLKATLSSLVSL